MSRRQQPLTPGERCPAERNNSWNDPKVTITEVGAHRSVGTRTCGRCGRPGVRVEQAYGAKFSAWYYEWHNVPGERPPSTEEER